MFHPKAVRVQSGSTEPNSSSVDEGQKSSASVSYLSLVYPSESEDDSVSPLSLVHFPESPEFAEEQRLTNTDIADLLVQRNRHELSEVGVEVTPANMARRIILSCLADSGIKHKIDELLSHACRCGGAWGLDQVKLMLLDVFVASQGDLTRIREEVEALHDQLGPPPSPPPATVDPALTLLQPDRT